MYKTWKCNKHGKYLQQANMPQGTRARWHDEAWKMGIGIKQQQARKASIAIQGVSVASRTEYIQQEWWVISGAHTCRLLDITYTLCDIWTRWQHWKMHGNCAKSQANKWALQNCPQSINKQQTAILQVQVILNSWWIINSAAKARLYIMCAQAAHSKVLNSPDAHCLSHAGLLAWVSQSVGACAER